MTTVWDLFKYLVELAIGWMKETTFFYGVSVWQLSMAFFSLWGLAWIIGTIFRHPDEDEGGGKE